MLEGLISAAWVFSWGLVAASGVLLGAVLALTFDFGHRTVAAIMSIGAGVLISFASVGVVSEALMIAGAISTVSGIIVGAAIFSVANAALTAARNRKRCGECTPQPSETEMPGSGASIALGTALDAVPEALILGITLRTGGLDLALILTLAFSNLPEALSGTLGMRLASRSWAYVLLLWSGIAFVAATATTLAFFLATDLSPGQTAILKAYGAGALISMVAETMIPEAFHNGPRYSGVLAGIGFAAVILLGALIN